MRFQEGDISEKAKLWETPKERMKIITTTLSGFQRSGRNTAHVLGSVVIQDESIMADT